MPGGNGTGPPQGRRERTGPREKIRPRQRKRGRQLRLPEVRVYGAARSRPTVQQTIVSAMRNNNDKKIILEVNTMPRGDRTGPLGLGPMTGRGAGLCTGHASPGYITTPEAFTGRGIWPGGGRSAGFRGCGRGFRNMFYATGLPGWLRFGSGYYSFEPGYSCETSMEYLKTQAGYLSNALEAINKQINEMEHKKDASE